MDSKDIRNLQEAYLDVYTEEEWIQIDEGEGSYGATPKAHSAASRTRMTAKRKPFLNAMKSRTNPANRTDPYDSPRKGLTADDRERARAGSAYGVGTRQDHDYPSQGPGGVTKSAKKLRKQKAMGEFGEQLDIYDIVLSHLLDEGYATSEEAAEVIMVNMSEEWRDSILSEGEKPLPYGRMMKKSDELADSDDKKNRKRAAKIYIAANAPKGPKVKIR
jgi:hypothetical protein